MPGAGHYDWGQKIDSAGWENTVRGVLASLRGQKLLMLCHDSREWEIAGRLAPEHPRFLPSGALSYFRTLRRAKAAVVNRLHAAVALAGLGVPSVAVGTDTRLMMVEALGLPALYVKDAHEDVLVKTLARLLYDRESERRRLLHLREQTWLNYLNILSLPARRREAA
jgi:polysaccharide pyruvyl transferase WcaK-like protein